MGVDPYVPNYDEEDDFVKHVTDSLGGEPDLALNLFSELVQENFSKFNNSRLVRSFSSDFFDENFDTFDFIFVDGNHKFEFVTRDLEGSWNALEVGGILAGDDYLWPEVREAVESFASRKSRRVHFVSNEPNGYPIWYINR